MTALSLSGCPLKRLEIHGGPTHSTYDANNLDSSLTATLEAQRSTTGNHSNLLLQSHLGLQRIVCISGYVFLFFFFYIWRSSDGISFLYNLQISTKRQPVKGKSQESTSRPSV